jgi:hypothetical protein
MTEKSPHAPSAKWTPTPWHVDHTINENMISQVGGSPILACLCRQSWDENDANAQRIVAAVNALSPIQGDPAEALAKARAALAIAERAAYRKWLASDNSEEANREWVAMLTAKTALGSPL